VKRIISFLTLSAIAAASYAQITRPILLTGPDAQGSSLQQAQEVVQLAAQHGYNGISMGIGMDRMTNPSIIDVSGVQAVTHAAMVSGLKYICWRLDMNIPNNQAWGDAFNGGEIWPIGARPPASTWPRIAAIWQAVKDASAQQIIADGGDPNKVLIFVLGNEPGIGGVGSASLDAWSFSGFYYSLFQSTGDPQWFLIAFPEEFLGQPEGYIEPGYWTMLRAIRNAVKFGGKTYCVSFEGAEASLPGQIASVTGDDAAWVYANTYGFAINIFGTNARKQTDSITGTTSRAPLTPVQEAAAYATRVDKLLAICKANPILANERVLITEFNISSGRVPDFVDPFPYREEILKQGMNYPGIDGAMIFTAYASDLTTNGMQLFNRVVVNGAVTITPVGSNPVGPKYVNLVP